MNIVKEQEDISEEEKIQIFLSDSKNKEMALESANVIKNGLGELGNNWFKAMDVRNHLKMDLNEVFTSLQLLILFGFCYSRFDAQKEQEYIIIFSDEERLIIVNQDIAFYNEKIINLKKEAAKLKSQIKVKIKSL